MTCRCETRVHPRRIVNPPNRSSLAYRAGDFLDFRHALLLSRAVERQLGQWRPGADGDLAVQMAEWWAYIADILTFYNERLITSAFVRTAGDEALRNLTRILGYRPRPGIAATGVVAALLANRNPITLPAGFQIESKPGPGKQPQMFELDEATIVSAPDSVPVDPLPDDVLSASLLIRGGAGGLARGDELLLIKRAFTASAGQGSVVTVDAIEAVDDARGRRNTRIQINGTIPSSEPFVSKYRLQRSTQIARARAKKDPITTTTIHLGALHRDITPGSPIVFVVNNVSTVCRVTGVIEQTYYANGADNDPDKPPAAPAVPNPILSTLLTFEPAFASAPNEAQTSVRFGWTDVGELISTPVESIESDPAIVVPRIATSLFEHPRDVAVEDADGRGTIATASTVSSGLQLAELNDASFPLTAPLRLLPNLLRISRGKTVANELLGSGDASVAGQDFTLRNAPVTYRQDAAARSGDKYSSTIALRVNGVLWNEARSFYGQPPDATIFVTYEDAAGKTHVRFGDGVNGARLPSGVDNVTASYRFGSGLDAPAAGELTNIVKPLPGLQAIRNPAAVGGGDDPESADRLRELAPRSVLTFGRAVSGADYEAIASAAPGVRRVRSYWSFDALEQRAHLKLYVGGAAGAVDAARAEIAGAGESDDAEVIAATAIPLRIVMKLVVDPKYVEATVAEEVKRALADAEHGLFSPRSAPIGRAVYRSAVYAAALAVPGALAVDSIAVRNQATQSLAGVYRYEPGEGGFFEVSADAIEIDTEVATHGA